VSWEMAMVLHCDNRAEANLPYLRVHVWRVSCKSVTCMPAYSRVTAKNIALLAIRYTRVDTGHVFLRRLRVS
jgi:hypothetical protein